MPSPSMVFLRRGSFHASVKAIFIGHDLHLSRGASIARLYLISRVRIQGDSSFRTGFYRTTLTLCMILQDIKSAEKVIKRNWSPRTKRSQFEQYDRDEVASEHGSILARIPDDTIYIALDCDDRIPTIRFPYALQWMWSQRLVDKAMEAFSTYVRFQPPYEPDVTRHALDDHWCRMHPEFHKDNDKYYPGAAYGVYHFGCDTVRGHEDEGPKIKPDSGGEANSNARKVSARNMQKLLEIWRIRHEMMYNGVFVAITYAYMFLQKIIDPELEEDQMEVTRLCHGKVQAAFCDDFFHLKALLHNVFTTDHIDKTDWVGGIAWMCALGSFRGGDFCTRQMGRRMGFHSGTIIGSRGTEVSHCSTLWDGKQRNSVVMTCKESLRRWAGKMIKESGRHPTEAVAFATSTSSVRTSRKRGREDLSDDEDSEEAT